MDGHGHQEVAPSLFPASFQPVTHPEVAQSELRQLFFAKVAKTAGEDEIKGLFSEYGTVLDVIIFQSAQGTATSKGCGLVTMSTHDEAAAAINGLHGKFSWSSRDPPMVVTWMDAALQDPARQHNVLSMRAGVRGAALMAGLRVPGGLPLTPSGVDTPPMGCDPDAIKLFVGNIPLSYTEEQLLPVFQQLGPVVELVVVRNKLSLLSKGCAFVWYASRGHAEAAIAAFNLRHVLPDVTGVQQRPLVVRRARTGHGGGSGGCSAGLPRGPLLAAAHAGGIASLGAFASAGQPQQLLEFHHGAAGLLGGSGRAAIGHLARQPVGGGGGGAQLLQGWPVQVMHAGTLGVGSLQAQAPQLPPRTVVHYGVLPGGAAVGGYGGGQQLAIQGGQFVAAQPQQPLQVSYLQAGPYVPAGATIFEAPMELLGQQGQTITLRALPSGATTTTTFATIPSPGTSSAYAVPAGTASILQQHPQQQLQQHSGGLARQPQQQQQLLQQQGGQQHFLGSGPGGVHVGLLGPQKSQQYQILMDLAPAGMASAGNSAYGLPSAGVASGARGSSGGPASSSTTTQEQQYVAQAHDGGGGGGAGGSTPGSATVGAVLALDAPQLAAINSRLFEVQASSGAQVVVSPGGPGSFNVLLSGTPQQVEQAKLVLASLLTESMGGHVAAGELQ